MQGIHETRTAQREDLIHYWQQFERRGKRIGGLLAILGAAVLLVLEQPGDTLTALAAAVLIAGGFTLILQSRTPERRASIHFTVRQQVSSRMLMASAAALFVLVQAVQQGRALFWVAGALLVVLALWYHWQKTMLARFDQLFAAHEEVFGDDTAA